MALVKFSLRFNILVHNNTRFLPVFLPCIQRTIKTDAIDLFTTDLVEQKSKKWDTIQENILRQRAIKLYGLSKIIRSSITQDMKNLKTPDLELDISHLTVDQLNSLLYESVADKNPIYFVTLMEKCLSKKVMPSTDAIFECLEYLSTSGRTNLIEKIDCVLFELKTPLPDHHSSFLIYKGLSLWMNGKHEEALANFLLVYSHNLTPKTKNRFHTAFKHIAWHTLSKKSEAVLVCLLRTADLIYYHHKDILPIVAVWSNCFDSKWFSDQQLSYQMYEKYAELRTITTKRSTSICGRLLKNHDIDSVHRLIELFLKYENKEACRNCLMLLFDYQYYENNLKACAEIIKTCTELDIAPGDNQNQKLVNLLLKRPTVYINNPTLKQPKFQYKF